MILPYQVEQHHEELANLHQELQHEQHQVSLARQEGEDLRLSLAGREGSRKTDSR